MEMCNLTYSDAYRSSSSAEENGLQVHVSSKKMKKFPYGIWSNPGPDEGWSWVIMMSAILFSMLTYGFANTGGAGLLYSEIIKVFDVTREQAMWPFSIMNIAQCFAGLSAAYLNSLFSSRTLFLTSSAACSLSLILCFWATDVLYVSFIFGILFGIGCGLGHSLAAGFICKYFVKYRSTATGVFSAGIPFGGLLYPLLANYIILNYDIRSSMLLIGGVTLHLLVASMLMRSRTPENFKILKKINDQEKLLQQAKEPISEKQSSEVKKKDVSSKKTAILEYVDTLRQPMFYVVSFQAVICIHTLASVSITLNDYLSGTGISRNIIVIMLSVLSCSDLVGRLAAGLFSDQRFIKTRKLAMIAMFFQGIGTFILCLTANVIVLFFSISLLAFMQGSGNTLVNILYCKYVGLKHIFAALSLKIFLIGLFGMLRPFVIGICRDLLGSYIYFYFLLGSSSILSSALWLLYPCMKKRETMEKPTLTESKV